MLMRREQHASSLAVHPRNIKGLDDEPLPPRFWYVLGVLLSSIGLLYIFFSDDTCFVIVFIFITISAFCTLIGAKTGFPNVKNIVKEKSPIKIIAVIFAILWTLTITILFLFVIYIIIWIAFFGGGWQ